MTAKEMFEELGFVCKKTNGGEILAYRYYTEGQSAYVYEIDFWLSIKEYCSIGCLGQLFIGAELHKAIHKQLEELGWLEEDDNN